MTIRPTLKATSWRLSDAVYEGLRNFASSGRRALVPAVLVSVLLGAGVFLDGSELQSIDDRRSRFVESGGNIVIAEGQIDLARCTQLERIPTVVASAGVVRDGSVVLDRSSSTDIALVRATSGLAGFADVDSSWFASRTALVDEAFALNRDWVAGREILLESPHNETIVSPITVKISSVADVARAGEMLTSGIIVPGSAFGTGTHCIAEFEDASDPVATALLAALVDPEGGEPTVAFRRGPPPDFEAEVKGRVTRFAPNAAGVATGLVLSLFALVRRAEYGLYRALGVGHTTLAALKLTEQCAVVLLGAIPVGVLLAFTPLGSRWWLPALGVAGWYAIGTTALLALLRPRSSVFDLVRDR